jgi:outer membrane murein-binding lipoprotein Lpp
MSHTVDASQVKELQKQIAQLEKMMQQLIKRVDLLDRERRRIKQEIGNVKNK